MPPVRTAGVATAPATIPEELVDAVVDDELLDLLCDEPDWLERTFQEIVATSWAEPPSGGRARSAGRPRRHRPPGRTGARRAVRARALWVVRPHGRQRSPPAGAARA